MELKNYEKHNYEYKHRAFGDYEKVLGKVNRNNRI